MHHANILIGLSEKWSEIGQWPAVILHSDLISTAATADAITDEICFKLIVAFCCGKNSVTSHEMA